MLTSIISFIIVAGAIALYIFLLKKTTRKTEKKITLAKSEGLHEPVHIHPYIDPGKCIGVGACIPACPEKEIIGLVNNKGTLINGSRCIGHGACAAACPVGAITLVFGTETRGVDIPYVSPEFETNIKGVYIVGELGGMGLIKNAVTQGVEAIDYIASNHKSKGGSTGGLHDVVIIGAGPAGIGASLNAIKHKLRYVTIDQSDMGGTVLNYPRQKIVMTSPVELPLYGKVKLKTTTKEDLLDLWQDVREKTGLEIRNSEKMTSLTGEDGNFKVTTTKGEYKAKKVVLAIGRRGTPRKLGVAGEDLSKVAYRLLEPDQHEGQKVLVVGGGDSAVEAAVALSKQPGTNVTLSYRKDAFSRIKAGNTTALDEAMNSGSLEVILNSNVKEIRDGVVDILIGDELRSIPNDYVYIFAGGELPNKFLESIGVKIEKMFGKKSLEEKVNKQLAKRES